MLTGTDKSYAFALAAHVLAAAIALIVWSAGWGQSYANLAVATVLMLSGLAGGIALMRGAGILAPLAFFMIGCGAYFGVGTMIAVFSPEEMRAISFTEDVQRVTLARVNAANAVAAMIAVAAAAPFLWGLKDGDSKAGLQATLAALERIFPGLLLGASCVMALQFLTFPAAGPGALRSLLVFGEALPIFTLVVAGAVWHRLPYMLRALAVVLLVLAMSYGVLGLTKLYSLFPMVLLGLGLVLGGRNWVAGVALTLIALVIYFGLLAEVVQFGRAHVIYDPALNSISDRARIVWETFDQAVLNTPIAEKDNFLVRLTVVPFEVYFMGLYDSGSPGDSLSRAPEVLIPRVLWPEKPIFEPGAEFDLVWRGYSDISSLAIAFVGEAYWNHGWLGVVGVSALIGAQLGWFTRKWLLFRAHGVVHLGVFLLSPVLVRTASQVESNIVGAYIAGTLKTAIMIMAIDIAIRSYQGYRNGRTV